MRRDRYEELVRFDSAGMAASPVMGLHDLARLPKAHLHLHFDGALRRETFEELAVAAGCPAPMPTSYGSFADFEQTIAAVASVLRTRADVARVVNEIAEDALCEGARRVRKLGRAGFRGKSASQSGRPKNAGGPSRRRWHRASTLRPGRGNRVDGVKPPLFDVAYRRRGRDAFAWPQRVASAPAVGQQEFPCK
jgi:Adenosine deaminase